ncbi:MAG TPA: alpha/beta hydrolase [Rhodospirillaceae bacterium]|nr:alpha/beta hydrolase [Rhodospirillaceae bacterium]
MKTDGFFGACGAIFLSVRIRWHPFSSVSKTLKSVPLALALLTSACAPVVIEAGPPVDEPRFEDHRAVMADGLSLPLRSWLPARAKAVVVAVHGFNDYSEAFDDVGPPLAAQDIAVYAFDLRGFGEAPGRGYWAGQQVMADDLATVARLAAARHPGLPLYLLGESMGGALVMTAMTDRPHPPVAGVILAAPAVWNRDSMTIFERAALWLASHTMPWLTLTGQGLNIRPSDNDEMLKKLSRDPLIIKETRVDAIHGLCDLMDDAAAAAPRLHVPALILYGEHDEVVPAEPTYRMMAHLPNNPVPQRKAVYANGYHMLLRDLQGKLVIDDIAWWISRPGEALPSGADRRAAEILASRRQMDE